jgi:hypothetical protein
MMLCFTWGCPVGVETCCERTEYNKEIKIISCDPGCIWEVYVNQWSWALLGGDALVLGPLQHFVRNLFLRLGVASLKTKYHAEGPPFVDSPRLLIQYIRSYPSYLKAVSSISKLRTCHAVVTRDPLNVVTWKRNFQDFKETSNHCVYNSPSFVPIRSQKNPAAICPRRLRRLLV